MASQDDCGRQGTLGKCITPRGSWKHPLVLNASSKKKVLMLVYSYFFFSDYIISCFVESLSHV